MSVNIYNKANDELAPIAGGTLYADLPIGSIIPYGGSTAPSGWFLCQGQAVSRTDYAELFAAIGIAFGSGDGSTTFNIPDLRGKTLVGYNSSETEFNTIGKTGGEKTHTLAVSEMPSHSHSVAPITAIAINYGCVVAQGSYSNSSSENNPVTTTQATGGGQAHNNIQPYNTVNYIIKAKQIAIPADFINTVKEVINTESMPASVTRMSPIAGGFAVFNLPAKATSARIVLLDKYGASTIPGSCPLIILADFTSETDSMWYASITDINTTFGGADIANGDAIGVKIEITY